MGNVREDRMYELATEIVKMSSISIPKFETSVSSDNTYYYANKDDKRFEELLKLYRESVTHGSIINNLHREVKLHFPNDPIASKLILDDIIFGGYCVEVEFPSNDHSYNRRLKHIPFEKVRVGLLEDGKEKPTTYYFSNSFTKYHISSRDNPEPKTPYDPNNMSIDFQYFYYGRATAGEQIYPLPMYYQGMKAIYEQVEISYYFANLVKNNFIATTLVSVNYDMPKEEWESFKKDFRKNFGGQERDQHNAGAFVMVKSQDKEHAPTITPIDKGNSDERYEWRYDKIIDEIAQSHNYPIVLLTSIPGKLGTSIEVPFFEERYRQTIVKDIVEDMQGYVELKNKTRI